MSPTPGPDTEAQITAVLEPIDGVTERPLGEHPAAYERVHDSLRAALAGETPTLAG